MWKGWEAFLVGIAYGCLAVFALSFMAQVAAVSVARGAEHAHPAADVPLHEKFYSTWYMPDNPKKSCCNKSDCYPTTVRFNEGRLEARRREDGAWLPIPPNKIERNRDNPDGRNHICAPPPNAAYPPNTVFCFALGGGI